MTKINVPRCVICGDYITKSDRKDYLKYGTCNRCTIPQADKITVSKPVWWPFVFLLIIAGLGFAQNWTLSQDGQYVSWSNTNALINCTATSHELITQTQICNFTYTGASPLTLNTSLAFNLADGVTPKKAYLWQNISHTLYHDIPTPTNHSVIVTPTGIQASTAPCDWGAGALKYNLTFTNGSNSSSNVYCFDTFQNSSGTYTLWSVWNDSVSTPYTAYFYDWSDITSSFSVSQFGTYKVGTIQATWTQGTTRTLKFEYDTNPNTAGKFDIYFHTGSAAQAVANPNLIVLALDPWWNASWNTYINCTVNSTALANDSGIAVCVLNTNTLIASSKMKSDCSDIRPTSGVGAGSTQYDYEIENGTCNTTATPIYIYLPSFKSMAELNTITIWFNNSAATDASNGKTVCTDDGASAIWHFGGSGADSCGTYNTTASGSPKYQTTSCKYGTCINTSAGNLNSTSVAALVSPDNLTVLCWGFKTADGSTNNGAGLVTVKGSANNWEFGSTKVVSSAAAVYLYQHAAYSGVTNLSLNTLNLYWARVATTTTNQVGYNATWDKNSTGTSYFASSGNILSIGDLYMDGLYRWVGTIDECRIYLTAKSANQIQAIYGQTYAIGNATSISFPTIAIQSPTATNYRTTSIPLNYTTANATFCWYSLNGGANQSLASCANATLTGVQGLNNLTVYANDTANNTGSASVSFTVDTIPPILTIQLPANTTYTATNRSLNFTTDATAAFCQYSLNGGVNISLPGCANGSFGAIQGGNTITVYANDSLGNLNSSTVSFFVDSINPAVSIQTPTNTTYATTTIPFNFTVIDTNRASCWYILDAGANTTLASCANTTLSGLTQGGHNISLWANDTLNNRNSSTVSFTVDTIPPTLTIQLPANTTYTTTNRSLNFTTDATAAFCQYSLNGAANVSLPSCANTTFTAAQGGNTITVYANDTLGNTNSSTNNFFVDSFTPVVTIQLPTGIYPTLTVPLNYTAIDANRDKCWYNLNGAAANTSLASCANTTITGAQGVNNLIVYANDSVNNIGSDSISFTVYTSPTVTITSPANVTYMTHDATANISLIFNQVNPYGTGICWYSITGTPSFIPLPGCANISITGLTNGTYTIVVYANDTWGRIGNATVTFTIYTFLPFPINEGIFGEMELAIGNTFMDLLGNPIFIGIMLLIIFGGLVLIAKVRDDGRIMILAPAILLSAAFLPGWFISTIGILVGGAIIARALLWVLNR